MPKLILSLIVAAVVGTLTPASSTAAAPWYCTYYGGTNTYQGCAVEVREGSFTYGTAYPVTVVSEVTCALCASYVRQLLEQEIALPIASTGTCYPSLWCCQVLGTCGGGGASLPPTCERPRLHGAPEVIIDGTLRAAARVTLDGVLERSPYLTVAAHRAFDGFSCEGFREEDLKIIGLSCESAQAVAYASMDRDGLIVGAPTMTQAYERLAQEFERELRRLTGTSSTIQTDPRPPLAHLGARVHVIAEVAVGSQRLGIAWAEVPEYGDREAFSFGPYPVFVVSVLATDRTARLDQVGRAWSSSAAVSALRAVGVGVEPAN